jgi:uncharacterized protein YqgC (DUF456 family)
VPDVPDWVGLVVYFVVIAGATLVVPFGLPGTWLQVVAAAVLVLATDGAWLGWSWVGAFVGLAAVGEFVELLAGQWGARRFGGSRRAAWGALLGGIAGAFIGGIPIPIVGSLVMSFVGTFLGALSGEMSTRGASAPDLRVGLGAVAGRALGIAAKMGVAVAIVALSIAGVLVDRAR